MATASGSDAACLGQSALRARVSKTVVRKAAHARARRARPRDKPPEKGHMIIGHHDPYALGHAAHDERVRDAPHNRRALARASVVAPEKVTGDHALVLTPAATTKLAVALADGRGTRRVRVRSDAGAPLFASAKVTRQTGVDGDAHAIAGIKRIHHDVGRLPGALERRTVDRRRGAVAFDQRACHACSARLAVAIEGMIVFGVARFAARVVVVVAVAYVEKERRRAVALDRRGAF